MSSASTVKVYESSFRNIRGKKIYCKYVEPKNPRAIVFVLHGYAEHCLNYETLAKTFAHAGYLVMLHDHVGHGQSEGERAQIDNFSKYVDDVFQHLRVVRSKYATWMDVYLCGHSMGGALAVQAFMRKPSFFKGLLLIAPAIKTNPELTTSFRVRLANLLRRFMPSFPVATLDYNKLSSSPKVVSKIKQDRLRFHGWCKAAFGASLVEAMQEIEERMPEVTCPFIICQGEADEICIPDGARFMYKKCCSEDKELKMYPYAFHSLLMEPNVSEKVIEDLLEWIQLRSKPWDPEKIHTTEI